MDVISPRTQGDRRLTLRRLKPQPAMPRTSLAFLPVFVLYKNRELCQGVNLAHTVSVAGCRSTPNLQLTANRLVPTPASCAIWRIDAGVAVRHGRIDQRRPGLWTGVVTTPQCPGLTTALEPFLCSSVCLQVCAMRFVKIIERPNETYGFAAIDLDTGEVPLRLSDRDALVALCRRLDWAVQGESNALEWSRMSLRQRQRRGRARQRVGGGTKFIKARKRSERSQRAAS
jgi:hypothetical protein